MTPRRNRRRIAPRPRPAVQRRPNADDPAIDALYGLEPPIDSEGIGVASEDAGLHAAALECPYCGEGIETLVDLSAGSSAYIEDCPVCCQPIELAVQVDDSGALAGISASRGD